MTTPTLITQDDRLIVSLGKDVRVYRDLLHAAIDAMHAMHRDQVALEQKYARLLEDFRDAVARVP